MSRYYTVDDTMELFFVSVLATVLHLALCVMLHHTRLNNTRQLCLDLSFFVGLFCNCQHLSRDSHVVHPVGG